MNDQGQTLSSWKEIAVYLGRTVRTCQRLEMTMGLPVHRLDGSPKARVFAYPAELDAWLAGKVNERERRSRRPRWPLLASSALGVVIAAGLLVRTFSAQRPERSIAIILHPGPSLSQASEHLPDGIAEDIRNSLMQIRGFRVPGRISSMAVADNRLDSRGVGRALNVEYVLEIGVQVSGESLRVSAALIDTNDGFQRWAGKYDADFGKTGLFAIEDNITGAIVDQLRIKLLASERKALGKYPTRNPAAYDLYMKGRYLLGQPGDGPPREALRFFEEALRLEPEFALAHVGVGWSYMNLISLIQERGTAAGPKAEAAIQKALALDPSLAEAHALNAWIQFLYKYDLDAAGKSFERALELRPGDAMTRGMHAYYLLARRRPAEASKEIKLAIASDPLTPMLSAYSMWIHAYSGRNKDVLDEFKRIEPTGKRFEFAYFGAGLAYLGMGRIDESVEMFKTARGIPHSNGRPEAGLAVAYFKRGERAAAKAAYERLVEERARNAGLYLINLAWVAAELGDLDGALAWVEEAVRDHEPTVPVVAAFAETFLPGVMADPRFLAMLDRLRLPH